MECLESVYRVNYPNYDVIVVDNGSQDDSVRRIKEYAQGKLRVSSKFFEYNPENKPVKVFELTGEEARCGKFDRPLYEKYDPYRRLIMIRNAKNLGYTGGNNIGIKFALSVLNSEYVLLLNNDTVVDPGFIEKLISLPERKGLSQRPKIVGPVIMYYDHPGRAQFVKAKYLMRPFFKKAFDSSVLVDYSEKPILTTDEVHGAAMMLEKDVLLKVGLLDEEYFAYWEETDLSLRARRESVELYIVPQARVWHKMGSRDKKRRKINPMAAYLFGRNMIYLIHKNFEGVDKFVSLLFDVLILIPYLMVSYTVYRRDTAAARMFALGVLSGIFKIDTKVRFGV